MNRAVEAQIVSIINNCKDMIIATTRDDGFPQATYRLDPIVTSMLDYSKGFGHSELVEV